MRVTGSSEVPPPRESTTDPQIFIFFLTLPGRSLLVGIALLLILWPIPLRGTGHLLVPLVGCDPPVWDPLVSRA